MIPQNLIFVSAQPDDLYFVWQVDVMLNNAREFGISDKFHVLVWHPTHRNVKDEWFALSNKYPEAYIHCFPDEDAKYYEYLPVFVPHLMKRFYKQDYIKHKFVYHHDADTIFQRLPDFEKLCSDSVNYQANTSGYLDYGYLQYVESKGNIPRDTIAQGMADIVGIPVEWIKESTGKMGGAQYLLKDIDSKYWEDVERDSVKIYQFLHYKYPNSINNKYFPNEADGIQSWTAGMWAMIFHMWKRGLKTELTEELAFSVATDPIKTYYERPIYHNAGVVSSGSLFFKGDWMSTSPIGKDITTDPNFASIKYVEAIKKANTNVS